MSRRLSYNWGAGNRRWCAAARGSRHDLGRQAAIWSGSDLAVFGAARLGGDSTSKVANLRWSGTNVHSGLCGVGALARRVFRQSEHCIRGLHALSSLAPWHYTLPWILPGSAIAN